jgi:dephospho-CoA kinase
VRPTVPLVGLTGGMAAGKSTALAALERLGAAALSSDAVVHELYGDGQLRDAVVERFGADVAPGGVVDREALAERAFSDAQGRDWLEGLLWPLVGARIAAWLAEVRAAPPSKRARAAVVEIPLLFESGIDRLCDATIAVVAREDIRDRRAARRGHARAEERSARQLDQRQKAARATFVVHNDGSAEELQRELSAVLDRLAP